MQIPIVRASFKHGMTTESSGTTASPTAAGVVLGSAPARTGEIVALASGAGVGPEADDSLPNDTRDSLRERRYRTDIVS
jgi:hypothetical protein